MKKRKFYWLLAACLAMAGCINDADVDYNNEGTNNGSQEQVTGNGNVRFLFTLNTTTASGRDAEDSGNHEIGNLEEYQLKNVQLYFFNPTSGMFVERVDVSNITSAGIVGDIATYSGEATIKKGTYNIYALANTQQVINAAAEADFLANVENVSGIVNGVSNGIVMTNRGADLQSVVLTPSTDGSAQTITVSLERVLAKIELSNTKVSYDLFDKNNVKYATINLNNFKIVNLSKRYYTFRHVDFIPDGYETPATEPSYSLPDNFSAIAATDGYLIDPNFYQKTVAGAPAFNNQNGMYDQAFVNHESVQWGTVAAVGQTNSLYCYENAMFRPAQYTCYATGIMFRGAMSPAQILNESGTVVTSYPNKIYYFNYKFYTSTLAVQNIGKGKIPAAGDNATDEELKAYQIYRFTNNSGSYSTYYNYWIKHLDNNNPTYLGVMEYSIVRNNIYRIQVTNVKGLGPGTPDTDIKPIEDDVLLNVAFEIKPWIVRAQDAELE